MVRSTSNPDLNDLVNEPRESLDVEVKEWLDLNDNDHRALLAKEIIALANHGGGFIVIGFKELDDGSFEAASSRPIGLTAWSQDAIQSITAKYVMPNVQCLVSHRTSLETGEKFPVIVVPGGHRIPVRARAASPDGKKLALNRVYIRRPGPNSEEPRHTEEWDSFFERIVQNRQNELLEVMRSIMAGVIPGIAPTGSTRLTQLSEFEQQAAANWATRIEKLPPDASPRFKHGFYDFSFAIDGEFDSKSLKALSDLIRNEVRNHSGWPPFVTIGRHPFFPEPLNGSVECWIGPEIDGSYRATGHHDFWRVSPDGLLFTRCGYAEDWRLPGVKPGSAFDLTASTWRLGETVLEASYIAHAIGASDANLICHARWTGLAGRELVTAFNQNRGVIPGRLSAQDNFEKTESFPLSAVSTNLPEIVLSFLAPLYELFSFFELPKRLVEEELTQLQGRIF